MKLSALHLLFATFTTLLMGKLVETQHKNSYFDKIHLNFSDVAVSEYGECFDPPPMDGSFESWLLLDKIESLFGHVTAMTTTDPRNCATLCVADGFLFSLPVPQPQDTEKRQLPPTTPAPVFQCRCGNQEPSETDTDSDCDVGSSDAQYIKGMLKLKLYS